MKISLLLATRGRPERLTKCLEAIMLTVSNKKNIEIVFGVDLDDTEEKIIVENFYADNHGTIDMQIKYFEQPYFLNDKFNALGNAASNELLLSWANDLVVITKNWDNTIIEAFENAPKDKIFVGWINDGKGSEQLPRHYVIHKNYKNITGNYARGDLKHYFSDNWIYDVIYNISIITTDKVGGLADRFLHFKDIVVDHYSPVLKDIPVTEDISSEMNKYFQLDNQLYINLKASGAMLIEVNRLYEFIRSFK